MTMDEHSTFDEFGLNPTSAPQLRPGIDLASLRNMLELSIQNGSSAEFSVPADIAVSIIERAETAESFTEVYECWTTLEFSGGHWSCVLHDTTFSLDESCPFTGKSVLEQLHETLDKERSSALSIRAAARVATTKLTAVEQLVSDWESVHGTNVYMLQKLREALGSEQQ